MTLLTYGMFLIFYVIRKSSQSTGLELVWSATIAINGIVPTSHHNLVTFTHALHEEANHVIQKIEDIDKGRENAPDYDDHVFPNTPDEFWNKI